MSEKPLNWEKLEEDFNNGHSIVLFLGTGVNFGSHGKDFSWDALINHLLEYAITQIIHKGEDETAELLLNSANNLINNNAGYKGEELKEPLYEVLKRQIATDATFSRDVKTTIVKQKLGNEVYVSLIRDFLYSQVSKEKLEDSIDYFVKYLNNKKEIDRENVKFFSLLCIANLILRNRNVRAVVTQNYDQFLYDVLLSMRDNPQYRKKYQKVLQNDTSAVRDICPSIICDWMGQSKYSYEGFNIYHVHGYIPRYDEIQAPKDNRIVLSMDEFYEDSRNVYSWQIASQLHFLSQYTCIFCGLSLDDYTNQRLLHYVKGRHHGNLYYLAAGNENSRINDRIKNEFHEKNGLMVIYDENGFKHLYELLNTLQYDHTR